MKRAAAIALCVCILVGCAAVLAAGGDAGETLVSLSYLNNTYLPDVVSQAGKRVDAATLKTYESVTGGLGGQSAGGSALLDQRVKRGDAVSLPTGAGGMLLAGSAVVTYSGGAVIDITAGQVLASGCALSLRHRYLAGENTRAVISVTSDTAVISLEGGGGVSPSAETDYNALAAALNAMGIFKGTGTGYGSGYDLERTPTRIEGLVMFLRLMGEEQAALAYAGTSPFVDVPDWCRTYVAYAYAKGYTKGIGPNLAGQPCFGTNVVIGAGEYVTFVLRALGYSDSGAAPDFTWQTALTRGRDSGVLTAGEYALLSEKTFLRAQVAYVSYFALDAAMKDGSGMLLEHLSAAGALDAASVGAIRSGVGVTRIG